MLPRLSKTGRRTTALLLLAVLFAAVGASVILPVRMISHRYDESIADLEFQLSKYEAIGSRELPLKTRLSRLSAQRTSDQDLLSGESSAIAGAALQEIFKQLVRGSGGQLESTQVLQGSTEGVLERIGIRAQFTGNIQALQRILYGIEFGHPILFVDNLEIRAKTSHRRGRRNLSNTSETLNVALDIFGYRRAEEA